jgi:hypothetical protein
MTLNKYSVAFLVFDSSPAGRNALTEEKYKDLAAAFKEKGIIAQSVSYNDGLANELSKSLLQYDAVLVWINPIEQGNDRKILDAMLKHVSSKGCFISTHPDIILKMGTKDILYKTKDMEWGGDINMYESFEDFKDRFPGSLENSGNRVLKQYRGNGGNGVYKINAIPENRISVKHAAGNTESIMPEKEFYEEFRSYFQNHGVLIDQQWNKNIKNGMVRCYVSCSIVAGFGYQEINALADLPPSKRYYFTESCGLFGDLKQSMENNWIPELKSRLSIADELMPVIWDADFFINSIEPSTAINNYELCEINVSCVSPFPPSAIPYIVKSTIKLSG